MTTHGPRPARVESVIESVCSSFEITRADLLEGWRRKSVAAARRECCKKLYEMKFTLTRIGLYLNLHHASVHAAIYGRASDRLDGQGPVRIPDYSGEWAI